MNGKSSRSPITILFHLLDDVGIGAPWHTERLAYGKQNSKQIDAISISLSECCMVYQLELTYFDSSHEFSLKNTIQIPEWGCKNHEINGH